MEPPRWDAQLERFVTTLYDEPYVLEPLSLWQQHQRVGAAAARAAATIALIAVESPDEVAFAQVLLREFPHPRYGGTI